MRVLCVAAHPDDEVLGCGATLAKHVEAGHEVRILIFGGGRDSSFSALEDAMDAAMALGVKEHNLGFASDAKLYLADQRFDEASILDLVRVVEKAVESFRPEVVYTHFSGDRNKDHRIVADAVLTACRPLPGCSVKHLLHWETLSSTEWGVGFQPNVWVSVSEKNMRAKLDALKAYESEMGAFPHPRSTAAVTSLATVRGSNVGVPCAEAFVLVRSIEGSDW